MTDDFVEVAQTIGRNLPRDAASKRKSPADPDTGHLKNKNNCIDSYDRSSYT